MKQRKSVGSGTNEKPEFFPNRVRSLLRATKAELERTQGRQLSYEELGWYAQQVGSTAHDKLQKSDHPQIESLLGWLERLPESVRSDLLTAVCRTFPSLDHHRLTHDMDQVSRLKTLLCQDAGATFVIGDNEGMTTFVMTALGHSSRMLEPHHRPVRGIDSHVPDWFVPVEGVLYLHSSIHPPTQSVELTTRQWKELQDAEGCVVLLNKVLSAFSKARPGRLAVPPKCNAFIADSEIAIRESFASSVLKSAVVLRVAGTGRDAIRVAVTKF